MSECKHERESEQQAQKGNRRNTKIEDEKMESQRIQRAATKENE